MKNNIRYKGSINNSSVIIFLSGRWLNENSQRCYFTWENLQWDFCGVGCSCSFIFVCSSFCCCSSFLLLFFIHCFSTSSLTLPWTIAGFLHPFYSFSPAHHRVIRDTFILSEIFFHSFTTFWVGIFYPQAFFTLYYITNILPAFIKVSLGVGSSSLKFARLHADPQNTGQVHLLVWLTAIHNHFIQKNSFLNSTKFYHELLVVKV